MLMNVMYILSLGWLPTNICLFIAFDAYYAY